MKCRHLVGRGSWYEGLDYLQREKHQTLHFALSPVTLQCFRLCPTTTVERAAFTCSGFLDLQTGRQTAQVNALLLLLQIFCSLYIFPESPLLCRIRRSLIFRARASLRKSLNMREAKSFLGVYTYKLNSLCNWEFMGGHISIKAPIERSCASTSNFAMLAKLKMVMYKPIDLSRRCLTLSFYWQPSEILVF